MDATKRFILFDSSCTTCSGVAAELESISGGRLEARTLLHPRIQEMLDDLRPGWQWEPMLVEERDGELPKIYAGVPMRVRVLKLIGFNNSWRLARLVTARSAQDAGPESPGRRRLIQRSALLGTSLFAVGLYSPMANSPKQRAMAQEGGLGISDVSTETTGGGITVYFSQNGEASQLDVNQYGVYSAALTLYRSGALRLTADYDVADPSISLTTADGNSTYLVPETPVADDPVAAPYLLDIQTILALYEQYTTAPVAPPVVEAGPAEGQVNLIADVQPAVFCPCGYGDYGCTRITNNGQSRSKSCSDLVSQLNGKCSNVYCFGCCMIYDCDCLCGAGDYFCRCGRTGCGCTAACS